MDADNPSLALDCHCTFVTNETNIVYKRPETDFILELPCFAVLFDYNSAVELQNTVSPFPFSIK